MFRTVLTKTLYGLRWQLFGWTLGVMAIVYITMVLFPSFSQNGIEDIVNSVPDSLKGLVGNIADFKTIPGYIGQQIFGPNLYIITLVMTIMIYLSVSASEESDGRLQSMLSLPLTRSRVYVEKWLAATLVVTIVACSVAVALWLALVSINESADFGRIWQSVFELGLISVVFGTITFSIAFFTGSKLLTILITSVYTVAAFFITTLAPSVEKLQTINKFSLLHYYNNPQVMTRGIDVPSIWLQLIVLTILLLIGWYGFLRRDVRTA